MPTSSNHNVRKIDLSDWGTGHIVDMGRNWFARNANYRPKNHHLSMLYSVWVYAVLVVIYALIMWAGGYLAYHLASYFLPIIIGSQQASRDYVFYAVLAYLIGMHGLIFWRASINIKKIKNQRVDRNAYRNAVRQQPYRVSDDKIDGLEFSMKAVLERASRRSKWPNVKTMRRLSDLLLPYTFPLLTLVILYCATTNERLKSHLTPAFQSFREYFGPDAASTVFLLFSFTLIVVTTLLGRKLLQRTASSSMQMDSRPPIVYCRSFCDDEAAVVPIWSDMTRIPALDKSAAYNQQASLEEVLHDIIPGYGPFVTIGQPGEWLPDFGASRDYFSDSEWQNGIVDWFTKANLILIQAAATDGLKWELETIQRLGMEQDTLILFDARNPQGAENFIRKFMPQLILPDINKDADEKLLLLQLPAGQSPMLFTSKGGMDCDYQAAILIALYIRHASDRT